MVFIRFSDTESDRGSCVTDSHEEHTRTPTKIVICTADVEVEHSYCDKEKARRNQTTKSEPQTTRVYRAEWENEFPWLYTDDKREKLFCSLCRLANMKNVFATTGASK